MAQEANNNTGQTPEDRRQALIALKKMLVSGTISATEYEEHQATILASGEIAKAPPIIADSQQDSRRSSRAEVVVRSESPGGVIVTGIVLVVFGSIGFVFSGESQLLIAAGLLAVVGGTLLVSAGVIAYGVRVGTIQAYAKMGLIPDRER